MRRTSRADSAIERLRTGRRPAPPRRARASRAAALAGVVTVLGAGGLGAAAVAHADPAPRPVAQVAAAPAGLPTGDAFLHRTLTLHATRARMRPVLTRHRAAHAPAHRWVLPAVGPLTSPFGMRWGRLHSGIDIGAPYGSPIYAATDGVISYAGPASGYGELIVINDWDGTQTAYGHMSRFVRTGGVVHAGEVIAYVGEAGDATGPHLHFEVRIGGRPIDPLAFLRARGVSVSR